MKRVHLSWSCLWLACFFSLAECAVFAQGDRRQEAFALEQQGKNAEAGEIWLAIANSDPKNAEAAAHLGLIKAREEHYDEAISYYHKALALNPAIPNLQMNLGLALFKANQFSESIKSFSAELEKHPGDQRLIILIGMAHYAIADYFMAIPYLKQAAAKDPQNLSLRLTLAHSCLWSKQYPCVLDTYKEILALNAESAGADMLAGEALDAMGQTTGAIEQFRAAVRANPKEPDVHFGLAYLLWTQSQYAEAAQEFQAELDNDSSHAEARAYIGDSYIQLHDYAKAQPKLEEAATSDPSFAMVHRDLGIVYAESGREQDAVDELLKAVALDPKDVSPHWRLAKLYQSMGKQEEAKAELATASTMNKESFQGLVQKISGAHAPAQP